MVTLRHHAWTHSFHRYKYRCYGRSSLWRPFNRQSLKQTGIRRLSSPYKSLQRALRSMAAGMTWSIKSPNLRADILDKIKYHYEPPRESGVYLNKSVALRVNLQARNSGYLLLLFQLYSSMSVNLHQTIPSPSSLADI